MSLAPPPFAATAARREARRRARRAQGAAARRSGRAAEVWAALWLVLHGWRIVGFRLKTPRAEIDLLARRGGVLAAVEVKRRATLDDAAQALRPAQADRLRAAAADLAARRPAFRGLSSRLDVVALAPGRAPRHLRDV